MSDRGRANTKKAFTFDANCAFSCPNAVCFLSYGTVIAATTCCCPVLEEQCVLVGRYVLTTHTESENMLYREWVPAVTSDLHILWKRLDIPWGCSRSIQQLREVLLVVHVDRIFFICSAITKGVKPGPSSARPSSITSSTGSTHLYAEARYR